MSVHHLILNIISLFAINPVCPLVLIAIKLKAFEEEDRIKNAGQQTDETTLNIILPQLDLSWSSSIRFRTRVNTCPSGDVIDNSPTDNKLIVQYVDYTSHPGLEALKPGDSIITWSRHDHTRRTSSLQSSIIQSSTNQNVRPRRSQSLIGTLCSSVMSNGMRLMGTLSAPASMLPPMMNGAEPEPEANADEECLRAGPGNVAFKIEAFKRAIKNSAINVVIMRKLDVNGNLNSRFFGDGETELSSAPKTSPLRSSEANKVDTVSQFVEQLQTRPPTASSGGISGYSKAKHFLEAVGREGAARECASLVCAPEPGVDGDYKESWEAAAPVFPDGVARSADFREEVGPLCAITDTLLDILREEDVNDNTSKGVVTREQYGDSHIETAAGAYLTASAAAPEPEVIANEVSKSSEFVDKPWFDTPNNLEEIALLHRSPFKDFEFLDRTAPLFSGLAHADGITFHGKPIAIGAGSQGQVYRAKYKSSDMRGEESLCAIKKIGTLNEARIELLALHRCAESGGCGVLRPANIFGPSKNFPGKEVPALYVDYDAVFSEGEEDAENEPCDEDKGHHCAYFLVAEWLGRTYSTSSSYAGGYKKSSSKVDESKTGLNFHTLGQNNGGLFRFGNGMRFAMEHVKASSGGELFPNLISPGQPSSQTSYLLPPLAIVAYFGRMLLSALVEFERKGILHQDIKPANVMLPFSNGHSSGSGYEAKIVDFGGSYLAGAETMASKKYKENGLRAVTSWGEETAWHIFWPPEKTRRSISGNVNADYFGFDPVHWEKVLLAESLIGTAQTETMLLASRLLAVQIMEKSSGRSAEESTLIQRRILASLQKDVTRG